MYFIIARETDDTMDDIDRLHIDYSADPVCLPKESETMLHFMSKQIMLGVVGWCDGAR